MLAIIRYIFSVVFFYLASVVYIAVRTNQHNHQSTKQFTDVIEGLPQILEAHRMSGDLDYLIKAVGADMPGYDALYKNS